MNKGHFPIFRKIFNSDLWGHKVARDVFIYILGHIAHYPTKVCASYGCVELKPGQMVTGIHRLAEDNLFTPREIRTSLNYLQSTSRIARETTNKYSIITVINWEHYRDAQTSTDKQNDKHADKQTTSRRQHIRSKEVKNKEEDQHQDPARAKRPAPVFVLPGSIDPETWKAFEEHRNRLRKPMTNRARLLIVNSCLKIGGDPNALLDQSIRKGWQDVFPIKDPIGGNGAGNEEPKKPRHLCAWDGCGDGGLIGQGGKMYCRKHFYEYIA